MLTSNFSRSLALAGGTSWRTRSKRFGGIKVEGKPEVILLLANHNPRSKKLLQVLCELLEELLDARFREFVCLPDLFVIQFHFRFSSDSILLRCRLGSVYDLIVQRA